MALLPCPFKYFTGLDCPGCGFQRSLIALVNGNWKQSFELYPATIPVLFTFIMMIMVSLSVKGVSPRALKIACLTTGSIIVVSYMLKMFTQHLH